MSLDASIRLTLGPLDLAMAITVDEGEVVALLGPNGAGKTTLLRAVAGVIPFHSGHVRLDGTVLEDTSTREYVPTEQAQPVLCFRTTCFSRISASCKTSPSVCARAASRAQLQSKRPHSGWTAWA